MIFHLTFEEILYSPYRNIKWEKKHPLLMFHNKIKQGYTCIIQWPLLRTTCSMHLTEAYLTEG